MKKTIIVIFSILLSLALSAQTKDYYKDKRHEVRLSIGSVNDDYYQYDNKGYYGGYYNFYNVLTPEQYHSAGYYAGAKKTSGSFGLSYYYHAPWLNGRFSFGGSLSYSNFNRNYYNQLSSCKIGHSKEYNIAFTPNIRYAWIAKPIFQFYSGIGASVFYNNYEQEINTPTLGVNHGESNIEASFMLTVVGFSIGRDIFAFNEINVGGRAGEFVFGVGYRF